MPRVAQKYLQCRVINESAETQRVVKCSTLKCTVLVDCGLKCKLQMLNTQTQSTHTTYPGVQAVEADRAATAQYEPRPQRVAADNPVDGQ